MMSSVVRFVAGAAAASTLVAGSELRAQTGVGAHLTPYAGVLLTGNWYDGPVGTNIAATNAPMVGVQGGIPLTRGVSLVGNLAYASGDLRIGGPLNLGINVGSANIWLYDVGLELGGLAGRSQGIAPFVQGGIGGMTNDLQVRVLEARSSNVAYTAGVGVDVGVSDGLLIRVQAKDWIGRFNSEDAIGFRAEGNLAHNWALTAGVKLRF
ncbi:outer membrane beta-barrel protein [Gemmatimonas sp.]|uniref:outer membrane beta-barrel protein n=1 Tax=Gemmatimonas sp. TaxID=1962908 RepID=UPI0025C6473F|nr:outer membrane beta-barrel protein [Gemmatimonas sp.]MCA2989733.1 outer membrane beta-barrel protein [Gemmatimonas sp.]